MKWLVSCLEQRKEKKKKRLFLKDKIPTASQNLFLPNRGNKFQTHLENLLKLEKKKKSMLIFKGKLEKCVC